MSRKNRPSPSPKGELNVPTTEHIAQPPAEPNAPIQETIMELSQEPTQEVSQEKAPEVTAEQIDPTAKEMAAAEEANAARAKALLAQEQAKLAAEAEEPQPLVSLAAQGREALMEGLRKHAEKKPAEYVPPPRTPRQMAALEAELEAGRRAQKRAAEQLAARPVPTKDPNEGFTTPVYRPNDMVPDPITGGYGQITAAQ
jgi:hypothetical protein